MNANQLLSLSCWAIEFWLYQLRINNSNIHKYF